MSLEGTSIILSPHTRPGVHTIICPTTGHEFRLAPFHSARAVKPGPGLYRSQHSRTAYKCSYCRAVLPESCVVDWLEVKD